MGLPCGTSKPLLAAIAATLAFSGASARGAVLKTDRACYRAGESVTVTGGPFTPSGAVGLSLDGAPLAGPFTAGPSGSLAAQLRAPAPGPDEQRPFRVAASDRQRPALSGSVSPLVSQFGVTVRPSGGRPGARRRIAARGFTGGGTLYAHVVRHRRKATVPLGRLEGACGTLTTRARILRRSARAGTYRVQFDTRRAYHRSTVPRAVYSVRVRRRLRLQPPAHTSTSGWWTRRCSVIAWRTRRRSSLEPMR